MMTGVCMCDEVPFAHEVSGGGCEARMVMAGKWLISQTKIFIQLLSPGLRGLLEVVQGVSDSAVINELA